MHFQHEKDLGQLQGPLMAFDKFLLAVESRDLPPFSVSQQLRPELSAK